MDYKLWMTEVFAARMKPAAPAYADNRSGRRAKRRADRKRGKGFTK